MSETVGQALRAAREARGQTLEDVERVTRIRAKHLAALEAGRWEALPSAAHTRGFLKNYAAHIGLDPAEVVRQYEASTGRRARRRPPPAVLPVQRAPEAPPPPRPPPGSFQGRAPQVRSRRPRFLSADLLVGLVVTLVLVALLVWGGSELASGVAAQATATRLPANALGTPAAETPSPAPPPTATLPPTPAITYTGVNVTVRAELRTWVAVKADGVEMFAGLMPPGEARDFVAQNVIEVATGNGQGTRIIFNGVDQGLLGDLGEVVVRLWTLDGAQTPTPTAAASE
jgi:transcriptional regulator with XRE-family HTH domain